MEAFQERVFKEREDLAIKIVGLKVFMKNSTFPALPPLDQSLLVAQAEAMDRYFTILSQRITLFNVSPERISIVG